MIDSAAFIELLHDEKVVEELRLRLHLPGEPVAEALRSLSEAQARTDRRFEETARAIDRLTEAQVRTETSVRNLIQSQARTEARVEDLVDAQGRTEARVEELAIAQGKTEARVEELALVMKELGAAQARTQATLESFAASVDRSIGSLRTEVGALSRGIGDWVEEVTAGRVPEYLERHFGLASSELERAFVKTELGEEELDGMGTAMRGSETVTILVEVKKRVSPREVHEFARKLERARGSLEPVVALLVGQVVDRSSRSEAHVGFEVLTTRQLLT
ncbi:MAG: hypothetical protein HYV07_28335 [Deltaproteobacteria bacterium]|nr:hypothetical protein [Deltaproteobacteria bacterium]